MPALINIVRHNELHSTLVCFRASGVIVKAFATDFESLSDNGKLHVIVQNTGLVTADFFVSCILIKQSFISFHFLIFL